MILAGILFLLAAPPAHAQFPELPSPYRCQVDVNLIQARTVGLYKQNADGSVYGVDLYVGHAVSPIVQVVVDNRIPGNQQGDS